MKNNVTNLTKNYEFVMFFIKANFKDFFKISIFNHAIFKGTFINYVDKIFDPLR